MLLLFPFGLLLKFVKDRFKKKLISREFYLVFILNELLKNCTQFQCAYLIPNHSSRFFTHILCRPFHRASEVNNPLTNHHSCSPNNNCKTTNKSLILHTTQQSTYLTHTIQQSTAPDHTGSGGRWRLSDGEAS